MRLIDTVRVVAISTLSLMLLSGCDILRKTASSETEGRVVTLADGRKVVVSGSADRKATTANAEKPKAEKSRVEKPKADKSKADKSKSGKSRKERAEKKSKEPKQKRKKVKDSAAVTGDREVVGTAVIGTDDPLLKADSVKTPATPLVGAKTEDFTINGEWTIYSVRDVAVTGEERPYITFDLPAGRFYGNNGCNYINGDVKAEPNQVIAMTNVIATMKMCQDDRFQYLINLAINDVRSFVVREEPPVTFLDMKDASGRTILVLRRHNMDYLNGGWKVETLNGTPMPAGENATMTFDTTDLKIHGTTGCNIFNGSIFIDPDKLNSLQIAGLATTLMACPTASRETEFLLALEEVETARHSGSKSVTLYAADGRELFTLVKMDLVDNADKE